MFVVGICVCLLAATVGAQNSKVSITKNGKDECSGVVLKESKVVVVVTSAQCVYRVPVSSLKVKNEHGVSKVYVHPYYRPPNPNYNVAVLKLVDQGEGLDSSRLANNETLAGHELKADGVVKPESLKDCQKKLGNSLKLSSKMFCGSASTSLKDGSPLFKVKKGASPKRVAEEAEERVFGIYFYGAQGYKVFTKTTNSEISSFIQKYLI